MGEQGFAVARLVPGADSECNFDFLLTTPSVTCQPLGYIIGIMPWETNSRTINGPTK
jgi:hypothetical protein